MKTLVLGIGNPILTDDGVGIRVAQFIKEANPDLEVEETSEAGTALLEVMSGYEKVVIIDSIKMGQGEIGEVYRLELGDLGHPRYFASSHGIDIPTAVELGKISGFDIPECIVVYAIEVKDNSNFGETCTPDIEEKIPCIASEIMEQENLTVLGSKGPCLN
jgi:hydrogenase maturation protease